MEQSISRIDASEVLNRSLRLLEGATRSSGSRKQRIPKGHVLFDDSVTSELDGSSLLGRGSDVRFSEQTLTDMSITLAPMEIRRLLNDSTAFSSVPFGQQISKSAQDKLFYSFFESWQRQNSEQELFNTVLEYVQSCTDTVQLIRSSEEKTLVKMGAAENKKLAEIEAERNTWRLVFAVYQDRINMDEAMDQDFDQSKLSEKEIMQRLYNSNRIVRECQLTIDWLEQNASELSSDLGLEQFTDKTIAWENTLHELQNKKSIPYKSSRQFVSQLDPDAPRREKRPLHDLDKEDEDRLTHEVFKEIRCGRLEAAQAACVHAGQSWRAALLEGWRLYHDPNYTVKTATQVYRQPLPVEGNPNRDIWKLCSWRLCEDQYMPIKTRAAHAAFCGHLSTLLAASVSWEDHLWSYLKALVDTKVEREIREVALRSYVDMPQAYWNNLLSLEDIFSELSANKDPSVRRDAAAPDHVVQKFLILDQIPQLMEEMSRWIQGSDMSVGNECEAVSPHFLRFLTHLVLFLRRIGRSECENIGDAVIEAYVKLLMEMKECSLVAWYVSQLSQDDQLYYYSAFLEEVTDPQDRAECLQAAQGAGLNLDLITKTVVENIRQQPLNNIMEGNGLDIQPDVSSEDMMKISGLEWLLFYPKQRTELLVQANALVASFLACGNIEAARLTHNKIPADTIDLIINTNLHDNSMDDTYISVALGNLPPQVACATHEYMCYKAYLEADESFSDWFQHFHHAKPTEPLLKSGASFIEKVAFQQKHLQFTKDLDRWKMVMENQTKRTKALLLNILTFPMGWLVDDVDTGDNDRLVQLSGLRSLIVPKVTLLLHSVMSGMEDHSGCVALADLIASPNNKLYQTFSKQRLGDFLAKVADSSLLLLNDNKDAWGFPNP